MDGIEVRGSASAEELAAVLAALSCTTADGSPPAGYERWRQRRIALLRGELAR